MSGFKQIKKGEYHAVPVLFFSDFNYYGPVVFEVAGDDGVPPLTIFSLT